MALTFGVFNSCNNTIVSIYAIGSLLPDSNSKSGRRFSFNARFFERKIEKTDAESVDDIVDANNKDSMNENSRADDWKETAMKESSKLSGSNAGGLKAVLDGLYKVSTDWKKTLKNIIDMYKE